LTGFVSSCGCWGWAIVQLLLTLIIVSSTGCRSGGYRAANLPLKYRASPIANESKVVMAHLSSAGISNSQIAVSDLLQVTIASGRDDEKLVPILTRVSDDGMVELPAIGQVLVAGIEPYEASHNIETACIERGIYRKPAVTLEVKSKAVNHVTVLGEVDEPGVHEIPRNACDLASVLGAAGGLTDDASLKIEVIRHTNDHIADVLDQDIKSTTDQDFSNSQGMMKQAAYMGLENRSSPNITSSGKTQGELASTGEQIDLTDSSSVVLGSNSLGDRDIVMVHKRNDRLIYVAGLVHKPGQFKLPTDQDIHLLDAIALAGGISSMVADKVYVIRRIEGKSQPLVIQASLKNAKRDGNENLRLTAGDTINIEQTPTTVVVDTFTKLFRVAFGVSSNFSAF
jgi:polysaccharide export outer membrane protein